MACLKSTAFNIIMKVCKANMFVDAFTYYSNLAKSATPEPPVHNNKIADHGKINTIAQQQHDQPQPVGLAKQICGRQEFHCSGHSLPSLRIRDNGKMG